MTGQEQTPLVPADAVADALDGYRIDGELGRGAMGQVFGGVHLRLDRQVAIKRLPQGFASDPQVRSRFGAEAQVLASLDHPHVVPVYDYVEREDICLLVMQALPGGTVWERFCEEGVSMTTACAAALATCAGLSHAHERRVLHRDVKPDNLMFDEHRQLKVTDFGIATVLGGDGTLATVTGEVIGTPAYMAPEQADGSAVGPPADVYAVATMLYELLSGRLPFSEEGEPIELLRRRLSDEPVPLNQTAPSVPADLAAVVMSGLDPEPSGRPATAEAFGVDIARAAVGAWGNDWLDRADVRLLAGGTLATAATSAPPGQGAHRTRSDSTATDQPTTPDGRGRETLTPGQGPATGGRADETMAPGRDHESPVPPPETPTHDAGQAGVSQQRVRPTHPTVHRGGADLSRLGPRDMVPVSRAIGLPRWPWISALVTIAAAALTLVVGLSDIGRGTADTPSVAPGEVVVAGIDASSGEIPEVNLADPVPVFLGSPPPGAATLQMQFSIDGLPLGSSNEVPLQPIGNGLGAAPSAASPRVVASGVVDVEMYLRAADGSPLDSPTVEIKPDRPVWLSAGGWLAMLLTALVVGFASSLAAPLRRGRRRVRSTAGLVLVGAVAGATVVLWAWCLGGPQPSPTSLLLASVLGALTFGSGSVVLVALGRRRRLRRRMRARARARADASARRPAAR